MNDNLTEDGIVKYIQRNEEFKNYVNLAKPIVCKKIGITNLKNYQVIEYIVMNFLKNNNNESEKILQKESS